MASNNPLRSGNPALNEGSFRDLVGTGEGVMTLQGTVNKTGLSLLILIAGAALTWNMEHPQLLVLVGAIGGFVVAMITAFKQTAAPFTTPLYAFLEGLFL